MTHLFLIQDKRTAEKMLEFENLSTKIEKITGNNMSFGGNNNFHIFYDIEEYKDQIDKLIKTLKYTKHLYYQNSLYEKPPNEEINKLINSMGY